MDLENYQLFLNDTLLVVDYILPLQPAVQEENHQNLENQNCKPPSHVELELQELIDLLEGVFHLEVSTKVHAPLVD